MKTPQEIFALVKEKFGELIVEQKDAQLQEFLIVIKPEAVKEISLFLRDTPELAFDSLVLLTAVDEADGKKNQAPDGSFDYEGGTLSLVYHLESTGLGHKLTLKACLPRENPEIESVAGVWLHANWEEREAYDMMGVVFKNHPDMRRILMPYDWEGGYPLRKDYRNPEFYKGMKVPN